MSFLLRLAARLGLSALIPGAGLLTALGSIVQAVIAFFSTPLGKWVGLGLIGFALFIAGDIHRGRLDAAHYSAKWDAAVRKAEAARTARDDQIRREVATISDQRTAEIQHDSDQLQAKVADYEKTLSNVSACAVSPDDARRLRDLGYGPGADQSHGAVGVRSIVERGRAAIGKGRR